MFEIIWGLLNIFFGVGFVFICFKSTKLIKEKMGVFASLIFVFGLFSFVVAPNDSNNETNTLSLQDQDVKEMNSMENTYSTKFKLEENLTTDIELFVNYGQSSNGIVFLSSSVNRVGFVSGTNWKLNSVNIETSKNKNYYNYVVSGIVEWKILGMKIYSEPKHFRGTAKL